MFFLILINSVIAVDYELEIEDGKYKLKIDDFEIESEAEFFIYENNYVLRWYHQESSYISRSFQNIEKVGEFIYCEKDDYVESGQGYGYRKEYNDCIDVTPKFINTSDRIEYRPELISINIKKNNLKIEFYADENLKYDPVSQNYTVGLVACYSFDTDGSDDFGSYDLSNNGAVHYDSGSGISDGYYEFTSANNYMNNSDISVTGDWTVLIHWRNNETGTTIAYPFGETSQKGIFSHYSGNWGLYDGNVISASSVNTGEWHQYLVVWDEITGTKNKTLYLDGSVDTSVQQDNADFDLEHIVIGMRDLSNWDFTGGIDEIAIWSIPLSKWNATDLYQSGSYSTCSEIIASGSSACEESLTNTSWINMETCQNDNLLQQNRTTYDINNCGFENVTFYQNISCCYQLESISDLLNSSNENDSISLTWTNVVGAEKYLLYNYSYNFVNDTSSPYVHEGLYNNTLYNYSVYAYNLSCVLQLSNVSNYVLTYTQQNLPCTNILLNTSWSDWYLYGQCNNLTGLYNRSHVTYNSGTCSYSNVSFEEWKNDSCECETTNYVCRFYELEVNNMNLWMIVLWLGMIAIGYWQTMSGNEHIGLIFLIASTGVSASLWSSLDTLYPYISMVFGGLTVGGVIMWFFVRSKRRTQQFI